MMRGFLNGGTFDRFGQAGNYQMMGQFWWVGGLLHILFWVGLIILIVWIVKQFTGKKHSNATYRSNVEVDDTSLAIARERYAKGEITKEQFDQLKKDLE